MYIYATHAQQLYRHNYALLRFPKCMDILTSPGHLLRMHKIATVTIIIFRESMHCISRTYSVSQYSYIIRICTL